MLQRLDLTRTTWHITFGTYGARLHGGERPTVDRAHNRLGERFVFSDPPRERAERARMRFPPVELTKEQQRFLERQIPGICRRGGWHMRICAAGPDHVHVLCDVDRAIHGEKVRRLIKRWLGEALSQEWHMVHGRLWWAEEGSNKAVHDEQYLNNAYQYILGQRAGR